MKDKIYRIVVDVWRLAARYKFQKMEDSEWESFVSGAEKLVRRYHSDDAALERLCRDLLNAFQTFYEQTGKKRQK